MLPWIAYRCSNKNTKEESRMMYSAVMNLGVGGGSGGSCRREDGGGGGAIFSFGPDSEEERSADFSSD